MKNQLSIALLCVTAIILLSYATKASNEEDSFEAWKQTHMIVLMDEKEEMYRR